MRSRWLVPVVALAGNLHSGAIFAAGVLGLFCLQAFWRSLRAVELALSKIQQADVRGIERFCEVRTLLK